MAIDLIDKLKPKNNGKFALMDAVDVELGDGTRLDQKLEEIEESASSYAIVDTIEDIPLVDETYYSLDPETYYVFGAIDSLPVYCNDPGDGKIHEFVFEFTPSETFTGITFGSTAPSWATPVQFPVGRVCQVSIMRGVGVMISA